MLKRGIVVPFLTMSWMACVLMMLTSPAHAGSSANYDIPIGVLDGGGQVVASSNYTLLTATAQSGEIGISTSANYSAQYGHISQQYEALPPTTPVITVTPPSPTTVSDLVCTVTTPTTVAPGLTARYRYSWSDGVDTVVHGPTTSIVDTLSNAFTLKHQTWTCSVVGYDGSSYSPVAATATVTVVNTSPGAPVLSIPTLLGEATNILCSVSVPSADPDRVPDNFDSIGYGFAWYVKRAGQPSFVSFSGAFNGVDFSIVSSSDTSPGDTWYCVVTPTDNEHVGTQGVSAQCAIVAGGITPSHISLALNPTSITLGEPLTALGDIYPSPGSPTIVSFSSTSPSGIFDGNFPQSVATGTNTYSKEFYPTEASEGRSPWQVTAWWPGNATYQGATSAALAFDVLKAQPSLSLSLSASSAPVGYLDLTATATLTASLPPQLSGLLSGRTINIYLRKPDGSSMGPVTTTTNSAGVAVFGPLWFFAAGVGFNDPGTWQLLAEFPGDANFKSATSPNYDSPDSARLTIKDGAGYAVIMVGKLDETGEGLAEHTKSADFVYRALRDRGFASEDIYYLRPGSIPTPPDIYVNDSAPSQSDLQYALQTWARDKMNASPGPLYVVLIDHGNPGAYFAYSGAYDETRIITPLELGGYLDTLQSSLNGPAQSEDLVVVYGACYSGSFLQTLSGPHRTVITSTSPNQVSNRGVKDPLDVSDVREGEPFVMELFRGLSLGKSLKESFEQASDELSAYTATRSNEALADHPQAPLLDDNGDGVGTVRGGLSVDPGQDGSHAHGVLLGYGVNAAPPVGWIQASQTVTLGPLDPMVTLFARATQTGGSNTAWLEVKSPSYSGAVVADVNQPLLQRVVDLPRFEYEPGISDLGTGTYRWSAFGATFDAPGTYQVYYYIKDAVSGQTSSYLLTTVYRSPSTNHPPSSVTLLHPASGAVVGSTVYFAWTPSVDPDGNAVTYRLEVAQDAGFSTGLIVREGLQTTLVSLSAADGLLDLTGYFWRVIPVDQYGLPAISNPVSTFSVDRNNPGASGLLVGTVKNTHGQTVASVSVTASPGNLTTSTDAYGVYLLDNVTVGSYTLNVGAAGYAGQSRGATVSEGLATNTDFTLTPSGSFRWGDLDGNDVSGTVDASLILQWVVGRIDHFPIASSVTYPLFPPGADVGGLDGVAGSDGVVGGLDAGWILKKRVGRIAQFPADLNGDGLGPDGAKGLWRLQSQVSRVVSLPAQTSADPGATVFLPLTIDDASGLSALTVQVSYSASVLEYQGFNATGALLDGWTILDNPGTGTVRLVAVGLDPLGAGGGTLLQLQFRVKDGAAGLMTNLVFTEATLNDGHLPSTANGGGVTVTGVNRADVNGDQAINAVDVQLVINGALGENTGHNCDVDSDGSVTAVDVQLVINAALAKA